MSAAIGSNTIHKFDVPNNAEITFCRIITLHPCAHRFGTQASADCGLEWADRQSMTGSFPDSVVKAGSEPTAGATIGMCLAKNGEGRGSLIPGQLYLDGARVGQCCWYVLHGGLQHDCDGRQRSRTIQQCAWVFAPFRSLAARLCILIRAALPSHDPSPLRNLQKTNNNNQVCRLQRKLCTYAICSPLLPFPFLGG